MIRTFGRRTCRHPAFLPLLWLCLGSSVGFAADNSPAPPAGELDTIVVQGQRLSVETKIDRKIYSIPEDAQTTLGTLGDILSAIPSVDIDPDGLLSLRGDTNVLVLIDGKQATQLQGSKAGDNLQSMSAKDLERIEVLTTPPAQFKAEGAAGVINIITKKHLAKDSASGLLQGSLGDGGRSLAGASATYGGQDYSASLGAGYREDYRQRTVQSEVTGADPVSGQILTSRDFIDERDRRNIPTIDFSAGYDLNERQSLTASAGWMRRGGLRTYTQDNDSAQASGVIESSSRRFSSGHDPEDSYNSTLSFSQKLGRAGETLDLSLHHSSSHQHEHYDYINEDFLPATPTFYNNLTFLEDHSVTEADADYSLPLTKAQSLKLGYSFERDGYGLENIAENVDAVTGIGTIDPSLTNDFKFHQTINAIYQSYEAARGAWTLLAGLRTEWTGAEAVQITNNAAVSSSYTQFYPSLHLDRSLSKESTLSMGASRRVSRPDPSYLNPYVDNEYTPNLQAGNPYLKPQYTQSFDLGYAYEGRGQSYGAMAYYRKNWDSVTDVTEYLGSGLSLTTKENLPRSDSSGLEFSANGRLFPKLSYGFSGNAFHTQIDARALGAPGLASTTGVNGKAKLDYRPTVNDSAQITFSRIDKRLTPQGSISAINVVNVGYKHGFSRSLTVVATVSDLFNGQRYTRVAATPEFTEVYQRAVEGRVAFFGFTYAIGIERGKKSSDFEYDSGN